VRESDPDAVFGVHRRAANAVAWLSVTLALIFGSALGYVLLVDKAVWVPLGPYPQQVVEGTGVYSVEGRTYPALTVDDAAVTVTGEKCVREDVTVAGAASWYSVQPSGLILQTGNGVRDTEKGCETRTFVNQIPTEVRVWAQALFDQGRPYVIMAITGTEHGVDGDRTSQALTWRTEDFVILPKGTDH
jgi:hypothetical protein